MGFIEILKEREHLSQKTHDQELVDHLAEKPRTAYIGFDPTAKSLHVGSLMQIMCLRRWQQAGHRVIVLVGGGTVVVGDPTGKTEMRQMLANQQIEENLVGIKEQLSAYLDLSDPAKGIMVNNADWLLKLQYIPFLREIGPHFSVNRMLTAECFKQRMEKGLSFLEFNYMLLQSYDFLHLYRQEQCTVQMGGDDQWSNILGGMELVRRLEKGQAFGITTPLLQTADGKKMGKTEKGAVWLDPEQTSPYEYFQFWRNTEDGLLKRCLKIYTDHPTAEIDAIDMSDAKQINAGKELLATLATTLLHGQKAADDALETSKKLFSGSGGGGAEPVMTIARQEFGDSMQIGDLLTKAGVFASKGEIRRLVQQNGLALDGQKVSDFNLEISSDQIDKEDGLLVKKGKKHYYRLRFSD